MAKGPLKGSLVDHHDLLEDTHTEDIRGHFVLHASKVPQDFLLYKYSIV